MIEIWLKTHLISDSNFNIVILWGMTNNVKLTFVVGETTRAVYN